ncbi:hypothetical protein AC579_10364 [Pseudocercospora musae]|uniref:Uncharacterized protein n=1 Tax=Pseudocercospora musae TaxID=113226 RepID=A0A139ICN6_9PEZI|nr:hypothetical protein AC579_10364 [Pseudocercospora musae]
MASTPQLAIMSIDTIQAAVALSTSRWILGPLMPSPVHISYDLIGRTTATTDIVASIFHLQTKSFFALMIKLRMVLVRHSAVLPLRGGWLIHAHALIDLVYNIPDPR